MAKQELGPNQEKWLQELESGAHQQGQNYLCCVDETMCCLGVAAKIFGVPKVGKTDNRKAFCFERSDICSSAPPMVMAALCLHNELGIFKDDLEWEYGIHSLTSANDRGKSFAEIAAFCRKSPEVVFKEPR